MKEWNSIIEMLCSLNNYKCNTMVLRNYELFSNNKLISLHEDIDMLCDDSDMVINALSATCRINDSDKIHLNVLIAGALVPLDLRVVGDSYYDEQWENDLLKRRVITKEGYYIPNPIDYIYSLMYHGLFHKSELKKEYVDRILLLAEESGLEIKKEDFPIMLKDYMNKNGYVDTGYRCR
ncbi:MAG: hypothetical protein K5662_07675 [Lachnospiraceae bacterium]|nr:hypothetical protein [Lachnospiraceae bacterium]